MYVYRQHANFIFLLWHVVIFGLSVLFLAIPFAVLSYLCLNPNVHYLTWPLTEQTLDIALPHLEYQLAGILFGAVWLSAFHTGVHWLFGRGTYVDFRIVRFVIRRVVTWYLLPFLYVIGGIALIGLPEPAPLVEYHVIEDEASEYRGMTFRELTRGDLDNYSFRSEARREKYNLYRKRAKEEIGRLCYSTTASEEEREAAKRYRAFEFPAYKKEPVPLPEKSDPKTFWEDKFMDLPWHMTVVAFWWMLGLSVLDTIRIQWRRARGHYIRETSALRNILGSGPPPIREE